MKLLAAVISYMLLVLYFLIMVVSYILIIKFSSGLVAAGLMLVTIFVFIGIGEILGRVLVNLETIYQ